VSSVEGLFCWENDARDVNRNLDEKKDYWEVRVALYSNEITQTVFGRLSNPRLFPICSYIVRPCHGRNPHGIAERIALSDLRGLYSSAIAQ
jgi:hypothetical protein